MANTVSTYAGSGDGRVEVMRMAAPLQHFLASPQGIGISR